MPSQDEIQKQLNSIRNWLLVSHKKNIIKTLEKLLGKDEKIIEILDGLYQGLKITTKGNEIAGVLLLTNKRILFVTSELRKAQYEEILVSDITDTILEKGFSYIKVIIKLKSSLVIMKTFANKASVVKFLNSIESKGGVVPHEIDDKTLDILDDLSKSMKGILDLNKIFDRDSQLKKIKEESTPIKTPDIDEEKMDFLFNEAMKINKVLAEYIEFESDIEFRKILLNEVIIISALCTMVDSSMTDEELMFISLVAMPLNPNNSKKMKELTEKLSQSKAFPKEYTTLILNYWDEISKYINKLKKNINLEEYSLKTMNILETYDHKHATDHALKVGTALNTFAQCLMKADGTVTEKEEERLKEINSLIWHETSVSSAVNIEEPDEEETLENVMEKINALVGMTNIKEQIDTLINLIKVQKERKEQGLPVTPLTLHCVFYGPPGTGKTTIARLLGKVFKCIGILKKGHLVETDRAGLVAGYVGQTAINVDKVVKKALDGVLFIDEAYSLVPDNFGGNDFGKEAVDAIIKRMEDNRERLVVIVAGYPDEMDHFIMSNPGLKSRFSRYFHFDHYKPEELIQIFDIFCKNVQFNVEEKARIKMLDLLNALYAKKDRTFGNGRLVRNIFERIIEKQANRIASISPLTKEILCEITVDDIPVENV